MTFKTLAFVCYQMNNYVFEHSVDVLEDGTTRINEWVVIVEEIVYCFVYHSSLFSLKQDFSNMFIYSVCDRLFKYLFYINYTCINPCLLSANLRKPNNKSVIT